MDHTEIPADFAARRDAILRGLAAAHPAILTPGVPLAMLGAAAGDLEDAAAQRLKRGTYPYPTISMGGRRVVLLVDVAATLAAAPTTGGAYTPPPAAVAVQDAPAPAEAPVKRGPGRPRKRPLLRGMQEVDHD